MPSTPGNKDTGNCQCMIVIAIATVAVTVTVTVTVTCQIWSGNQCLADADNCSPGQHATAPGVAPDGAGHARHAPTSLPPPLGLYRLAGHSLHSVGDVAPTASLYEPGPHGCGTPATQYEPCGHGDCPDGVVDPAAHTTPSRHLPEQSDDEMPPPAPYLHSHTYHRACQCPSRAKEFSQMRRTVFPNAVERFPKSIQVVTGLPQGSIQVCRGGAGCVCVCVCDENEVCSSTNLEHKPAGRAQVHGSVARAVAPPRTQLRRGPKTSQPSGVVPTRSLRKQPSTTSTTPSARQGCRCYPWRSTPHKDGLHHGNNLHRRRGSRRTVQRAVVPASTTRQRSRATNACPARHTRNTHK